MPSNSNNDALVAIKHQTSPWPPSLRQRCLQKSTILSCLRTQPYQNGGPPIGVLVFGPSRPQFWVDLAVIWHGDSLDKRQASLFSYKMSNLRPKLPKMAKNKKTAPRIRRHPPSLRKVPACFSGSLVVSVSPRVSQYAGRCGLIDLLRKMLRKIGLEVGSLRKVPACLSSSSGVSVSPQVSQYARRYGVLDLLRKC